MSVVRWSFIDLVTGQEYQLEINPNRGPDRDRQKNLVYKSPTAPDGQQVIFEGMDQPEGWEAAGVLLEQAQYDALNEWFDKRHQFQVIDDLGRVWMIYPGQLSMKRAWKQSHPWRHEWTMTGTVLSVA